MGRCGNRKIIQELEAAFRGAGWNVIKVVWGSDWDPLLDADEEGKLVKRMGKSSMVSIKSIRCRRVNISVNTSLGLILRS